MNWDQLEGQWKQRRGKAVYRWGKIMNDELATMAGKYEEIVGRLQEKYGIARDEASRQAIAFKATVEQLKQSNRKLAQLQKSLRKDKKSSRTRRKSKTPTKKRIPSGAN